MPLLAQHHGFADWWEMPEIDHQLRVATLLNPLAADWVARVADLGLSAAQQWEHPMSPVCRRLPMHGDAFRLGVLDALLVGLVNRDRE